MGTYAITQPNIQTRIADRNSFIQAEVNTYATGNTYRHQELVHVPQKTPYSVTAKDGPIFWSEEFKRHYFIPIVGGGSGSVLQLLEGSSAWEYVGPFNNNPQCITPNIWTYSKKHNKYYGIGLSGMAEYNSQFTYTDRGDSLAVSSIDYDTKRDLILAVGSTASNTNVSIGTYDPSASTTTNPSNGKEILSFTHIYSLADIQASPVIISNNLKFLSYSAYNDKYYFSILDKLYIVNPDTPNPSPLVPPYTASGEIMGFEIDGSSQYAYLIEDIISTNTCKLVKLDLATHTVVQSLIITDVVRIEICYLGKVVSLHITSVVSYNNGVTSNIVSRIESYNKDSFSDLVFKKNLYDKGIVSPAVPQIQFSSSPSVFYNNTTVGSVTKQYRKFKKLQLVQEVATDQVNVHFSVRNSIYQNACSSMFLNINPVIPYPTVTTPVVDDCCLSDLICDVKYKLSKISCEATKRSIVGRHFKNVWDNSQTLEAILWITTFDCLSCDEIEKLKCIISKI